jgi:hypothetical protein
MSTNYYQKRNEERKAKSYNLDTDPETELRETTQDWPSEPEFPPMKPPSSKDRRMTKEEEKPPAWDGDENHWDAYVQQAQNWTLAQKAKKEQVQEKMDKEKELYREQIKQEYQRIVKEEMAGHESDSSWMDATSTGRKQKK